jgi:hypothetical protein
MYEGSLTDSEGGQRFFYCYLAVYDLSTMSSNFRNAPHDFFGRTLRGLVTASRKEGDTPKIGEWELVSCESPAGRVEWQRIRFTSLQHFCYVDKAGKADLGRIRGTVEFYAQSFGNHFVCIGWQLPTDLEDSVELARWGPSVAGSVAVKE